MCHSLNEQPCTGFYYLYLLPWLQVFPRKRFYICSYMTKDTEKIFRRYIFSWKCHLFQRRNHANFTFKRVYNQQTKLHGTAPACCWVLSLRKWHYNEKLVELNDNQYSRYTYVRIANNFYIILYAVLVSYASTCNWDLPALPWGNAVHCV